MDTYMILRRSGWRSPEELQQAAERSTAEGEKMSDDVRWIRSYVLEEAGSQWACLHLPGVEPRGDPQARRRGPTCRWTRSSGSPTQSSSARIQRRRRPSTQQGWGH
jgi:hypothetical protein